MASEQHEIEVTFLVRSPAPRHVVQSLESLQRLGECLLCPESDRLLHDRYFDLSDSSLRKRGYALRLRQSGPKQLLCLKRRGDKEGLAVRRLEIEGPLDDPGLRQRIATEAGIPALAAVEPGPDAMAALLAAGFMVIHDRHTRRRMRTIRSLSNQTLASLAIDSVDFEIDGTHLWHHEVEIEAEGEADVDLLHDLATSLQQTFPDTLISWRPSKLRTGLALQALVRRAGATRLAGPEGDLLPESYALLLEEMESRP
jgi:hypothetical protein